MTLMSAPRLEAPIVTAETDILKVPGFFDRDAVGGGGGSWALIGFDHHEFGATPHDMTIPTDTAEGDLVLAYSGGRSSATVVPTSASYTQLFTYDEGGNCKHIGWYRYAGAAEGDTAEEWTSSDISRQSELALVVFRGGPAAGDPQDTTHAKTSAYDITPEVPQIETLTDSVLLVGSYGRRWSASSTTEDQGYPSGFTGVLRRYLNPSQLGICFKVIPAAGVVSAVDWGDDPVGETNLHVDVVVAIKAG
jgi:hypothetical protein